MQIRCALPCVSIRLSVIRLLSNNLSRVIRAVPGLERRREEAQKYARHAYKRSCPVTWAGERRHVIVMSDVVASGLWNESCRSCTATH